MSKRTVLVTGAAGGIGSKLLKSIREIGWLNICLVHNNIPPEADSIVRGDISDAKTLDRATRGVDAVLHLAALTHSRDDRAYFEINRDGTENLVKACNANSVSRFIQISTRAISESGGGYSSSKAKAEDVVTRNIDNCIIIRLPEVFGAGGEEGIDKIIEQVKKGRLIPLVGRGEDILAPVHVDDIVSSISKALDSEHGGKTYTLAGEPVSISEFVALCGEVFGLKPKVIKIPTPLIAAACTASQKIKLPVYPDQLKRLQAPKTLVSPEAKHDLDFKPRPLKESLELIG